jgi:hypothetical protein
MHLFQSLQFPVQIGKGWGAVLLILSVGCVNQNAGPIKKIASPERPAAAVPTQNPFGTFSPEQLYTAQTKTFLKSRAIESSQLAAQEKCEISENTQIVLKTAPGNAVKKHWAVQLQLRIPGCPLDAGYLFAEHWKQSPKASVPGSDPCGFPSDLDFSLGKQLAQEASRVNIGRFTGRCYEYAGVAIENIGLMPKGAAAWQAAGVPVASAADFVHVEKSSMSDRFVRLRPVSWSCLPEGTIVVWDRGVCGFNATHGHIEVVVTRSPSFPSETKLCSDGCQTLQTTCSIHSGVSFFFPRKRSFN